MEHSLGCGSTLRMEMCISTFSDLLSHTLSHAAMRFKDCQMSWHSCRAYTSSSSSTTDSRAYRQCWHSFPGSRSARAMPRRSILHASKL